MRICNLASAPAETRELAAVPWWAPLGGLVGAVQVYAGLTLVHKVGAGPFVAFTVSAALITSLIVDHFGLFRMPVHAVTIGKVIGAALMIGGIVLITR
jgi:transporter family-2 protein